MNTTFRDEHTDCCAAIIAKAGAITAEQTVGSYGDRDTNFDRFGDFRIKLVLILYESIVTSPLVAYCYFSFFIVKTYIVCERVYDFQEVLVLKIRQSRYCNT